MLAGQRRTHRHQVDRRSLEHHPSPLVPRAGSEIDDPVGMGHDRMVVFDHRFSGIGQPVEQFQQAGDIGHMQTGGRFVEDIDLALLVHLRGQLQPLPFPAGQRGQRLPQGEIAQPDIFQPPQDLVCGLLLAYYPNPASRARMIASARSATCNFEKMLLTWLAMVLGERKSSRAIV